MNYKRIWYEDGSYIDVPDNNAWEYENDPGYAFTEIIPTPEES